LAVEPRPSSTLDPLAGDAARGLSAGRPVARPELARAVRQRIRVVLPLINLVEAALTYVFIVYVVPLPGHRPAHENRVTLIAMCATFAVAWVTCAAWFERSSASVRRWLARGGEPDDAERRRALRMPLIEAGQTLAVWSAVAAGFGAFDAVVETSAGGGALVAVMVVLGGLVASALAYLAVERIMRPITALALKHGAPECRLAPGITARIYLAWEFGTAVAVGGAAVVAIAYLAGAHISAHRLAITVIFLSGIALSVGAITLLVAIRSVSDPVRAVRGAMRRVEQGDTEVTVPVDDGGEVGLLQAGFNRMVSGLRERDIVADLFGRHVGEEVARSALARGVELGGELREAAVLFVDVIGSTPFAVSHKPREVVQTLNRFFGLVDEVVTLHGGWVNKFEGDAALCVFGCPTDHPDAAGAALAAARELARRLALELDGLEAAIGLSAGTVLAGNIGAARRYEYTVIGDPVNEAARLTELAKATHGRLLASEAIMRRARGAETARWRLGERVTLRGRDAGTRVAIPA
jgi:adenylate cyclase